MSGNRKKAKRRTAKALQNLRKTPEKRIPIVTETKIAETPFTLCDKNGMPCLGKNNEPIYATHKTSRSLTELTPYGERLVEHCWKVRNGIDDPDFVFEDDYEEDEDDDYEDDFTVPKSEFTEYGKRLIEHYAKVYNGVEDPDFVFEDDYEEDEDEDENH